jgi:hypothetical protein
MGVRSSTIIVYRLFDLKTKITPFFLRERERASTSQGLKSSVTKTKYCSKRIMLILAVQRLNFSKRKV